MSTYTTKHGLDDEIWYLNVQDYKATKGKVEQVLVQESYPDPNSPKNFPITHVQYRVAGQYMQEDRVFSSREDLVKHVSDDSK